MGFPLPNYRHIWCVDFEYFTGGTGAEAPVPICVVAHDIITGTKIRKWLWGVPAGECPFPVDSDCLYVSYYASAEIGCHRSLGWQIPTRIVDLYAEFRCTFNGVDRNQTDVEKAALKKNERYSLLSCLFAHGLGPTAVTTGYKDASRNLCIRGGPFTSDEQRLILEYCGTDVDALVRLFPRMVPNIEIGPALLRGRYTSAVSAMERRGIPLNLELFSRFDRNWDKIVDRLISSSVDYFDVIGCRDVDAEKFRKWLVRHDLIRNWPMGPSGRPRSDAETLSDWSKFSKPVLGLKEFLQSVRRTKLFQDLRVGADGRNRFLLSPFGSKTGRNTPSNAKSVFGPACWVRNLIQPPPGQALLYCDWSGQEYGEAAYFARDEKMIFDYIHDDPYLGFAKRINLAPADATKKTHPELRNQLKVAAGLGVLYGAGATTVARAGNMTEAQAARVLRLHQHTYLDYWRWRQQVIDSARLSGELRTCFGWTWKVTGEDKSTSISNWMMQAHGAEMLRIACCLAVERGIDVCTPVHDALLVQAPTDAIEDVKALTLNCMEEASATVLGGDPLRVGVDKPVIYPDHFIDDRGKDMWERLVHILAEIESQGQKCP